MTRFRTRLWYVPGIGYRGMVEIDRTAHTKAVKYEFVYDTADERDARVRDIMNEHKQKEPVHG